MTRNEELLKLVDNDPALLPLVGEMVYLEEQLENAMVFK
jgi:hypothetical protein